MSGTAYRAFRIAAATCGGMSGNASLIHSPPEAAGAQYHTHSIEAGDWETAVRTARNPMTSTSPPAPRYNALYRQPSSSMATSETATNAPTASSESVNATRTSRDASSVSCAAATDAPPAPTATRKARASFAPARSQRAPGTRIARSSSQASQRRRARNQLIDARVPDLGPVQPLRSRHSGSTDRPSVGLRCPGFVTDGPESCPSMPSMPCAATQSPATTHHDALPKLLMGLPFALASSLSPKPKPAARAIKPSTQTRTATHDARIAHGLCDCNVAPPAFSQVIAMPFLIFLSFPFLHVTIHALPGREQPSARVRARVRAARVPRVRRKARSPRERGSDLPSPALARMKQAFAGERINDSDGVRVDFADGWVHLRASNTEPIARIIAEAPTAARAQELIAMCGKAAGL
ncbi:MAG: hypothetical protein GC172_07505 [Phycisphaera sp.]|nr:hypothetical protein [Phycisphaera sp.]